MHPSIKHLDPDVLKLWHDSVARDAALKARRRRWHAIEQALILILSGIAIALVDLGATSQIRWWGNVVGLAAQPLWLAANYRAGQWGMFALGVFYLGIWTAGVVRHF